jgi:tetratricopeptide (TPR) repeat protein
MSAGAVAAALGRSADAGVPGSLVGAAVRAAGGAVPAAVAHLASEVAKMMLLGKLKAGAMGFAAVTLLAAAIGLAAAPGERPAAKPEPPAKAAARPAAKPDEPAWRKEFNKVYGLADGEVLKRVPPPYPDSRYEFLKSVYGDPGPTPYEHRFTVFRWNGGRVDPNKITMQLPVKPDEGATLSTVLAFVANLSAQMVEGNPDLLNARVTGDFVVRDGTDPTKVVARLERILRDECKLPVVLAFEHLEQDVVVARGKFASKPLEGRKQNHVEIYARSVLDPAQNGSGGSGPDTLPKFLQHLGSYINRRIVNEVEQPTGRVSWTNNLRGMIIRDPVRGIDTDAEDRDPDAVLRNVAAQTGLTFKTEKRTVRALFVRKWDEKQEKARGHYEEALKLGQAKRTDEAIAELARAVELDPAFEAAYFYRSGLYAGRPELEKRDYKAAVGDLSTCLVLNTNDYSARFNRAMYLEQLKDYDQAIADFTQIIAGATDFSRFAPGKTKGLASSRYYRGQLYHWRKKDHDKAIADYTEALRLDPEMGGAGSGQPIHWHRGQCYRAKKMWKEADADFAEGVKRNPDYPNVLNEWAWQLATCPDPKYRDGKKAVELARHAWEKKRWSNSLEPLAAAHAEAGDFAKAVEWQTKAIELLDPKAKEQEAMQARLKLYEAGKPYHEE